MSRKYARISSTGEWNEAAMESANATVMANEGGFEKSLRGIQGAQNYT